MGSCHPLQPHGFPERLETSVRALCRSCHRGTDGSACSQPARGRGARVVSIRAPFVARRWHLLPLSASPVPTSTTIQVPRSHGVAMAPQRTASARRRRPLRVRGGGMSSCTRLGGLLRTCLMQRGSPRHGLGTCEGMEGEVGCPSVAMPWDWCVRAQGARAIAPGEPGRSGSSSPLPDLPAAQCPPQPPNFPALQ